MLNYKSFITLILSLCFVQITFAAIHANQEIAQKFTGAQGFYAHNNPQQLIIRIGIDPGSIGKHDKTNKAIMDRITVIACGLGECQFTKPLYGLGFYQATFKTKKKFNKENPMTLHVLACSRLGCVKKVIQPYFYLKMESSDKS